MIPQGIYFVTDRNLRPDRDPLTQARAALEGGARIVQLRDKPASGEVSTRETLHWAFALRELTSQYGALFIVNDRVDVALASDADGVHVGDQDMPVLVARKLMGRVKVIGVSVASVEQAKEAEAEGADYVAVSPVFATGTKPDASQPAGIAVLRQVVQAAKVPVVAIGGIGLRNIREVAEAGAHAAAVISAIVCAEEMEQATRELMTRFAHAKPQRREEAKDG